MINPNTEVREYIGNLVNDTTHNLQIFPNSALNNQVVLMDVTMHSMMRHKSHLNARVSVGLVLMYKDPKKLSEDTQKLLEAIMGQDRYNVSYDNIQISQSIENLESKWLHRASLTLSFDV